MNSKVFHSFLQKYLNLNISFLIILLIIRIFEYFSASGLHELPDGSLLLSLKGIFFDIYLLLFASAILLIPYLIFCLISQKAGIIFYKIIASLIIAAYLSLVRYFVVQLIPLGRDFFAYTSTEIQQTVLASGELKITNFVPFIIIIIIFLYLPQLFRFAAYRKTTLYIYYGLSILSVIFVSALMTPDSSKYSKDLGFYLVNNKLGYFIKVNYFSKGNAEDETEITNYELKENSKKSDKNQNSINYQLTTINEDYPFLHVDNTEDVLGQFFNKSPVNPNIVIILTESLSAAFTGKDAYLGSFTPFLDSLIERGLYWKNFLSTTGRTFGVNPAVLASLPFGKNGFLELGNKAPDHESLISILKRNGYYCSFYYGGDAHFDLMDVFFRRQGIDFILQQKDFLKDETNNHSSLRTNNYKKFPSNSGGFNWGYADREVFRKSFEIMKKSDRQPRLDVYMTLAMHSPFLVPDEEKYIAKFHQRLKQLGLNVSDKSNEYIKDKEKYASVLYTDDAIRYFINEYKKREDFKNTIFIITGDHRMVEIPIVSKIDKFHVPLIIYSPLIKHKETFEAVSSHLDITPTLLAFLKFNYGIEIPRLCSWLGREIDVNKSFRNNRSLAFMWDKYDLINYLNGYYFINEDQLFKLSRNMNIDPIKNDTILARMQIEFGRFKKLNDYVCKNNKLYHE